VEVSRVAARVTFPGPADCAGRKFRGTEEEQLGPCEQLESGVTQRRSTSHTAGGVTPLGKKAYALARL
jgi:hypothetical protein